MTINQTIDGVPREWLEEYEALADLSSGTAQMLRALLDAADHVHEWDINAEGTATVCHCGARSSDEPAEQPAPVAVVMPERFHQVMQYLMGAGDLDGYYFKDSHPSGRKYWWRNELRACLDELNTSRPTHANPPPGAQPSGTHPHNDGLDDYRNTK